MTDYSINIITNEIKEGNLGANFRKGDWRVCTQTEIDDYESTRLIIEVKEARFLEIEKIRNQKTIEDSIRYTEAETAKSAIDALTTIEEIEAFDIDAAFS